MIRKDDLIDVPERRAIAWNEFEVRAEGNTLKFEGYASIFDKGYDVHGGPSLGGWTESVNRSAFKRTLTEKPDVVLLLNHEGLPLARTKSGTLQLGTDSTGLLSRSDLDLRDPDVKSVAIKMERGDLNEMSFAFRVKQNTWSDNETQRSLDEVSLHKGDVSIVTFGANPYTSATLRSVIKMLANGDVEEEQMAELRAMSDQVDRAMALLRSTRNAPNPTRRVVRAEADPRKLLAGLDAVLDEAADLTEGVDREGLSEPVGQALDLIVAAQGVVGQIMGSLGVFDPDAEKNSLRPVRRALSPTLDGGEGFEDGDEDAYQGGDSLAQAVHDLVADAAGCTGSDDDDDEDEPDASDDEFDSQRNLTVANAARAAQSPGNLTLTEAARMCRPEDSPEPLTVDAASRLAS